MTEPDLKYLLRKPGTIPQIGPETGRPVTDGIAVFRSPQGSWRFVYLEGGKALSALQVMDLGGGRAQTKHVYTLPAHRHRGLAAKLLAEVRMKWVDVTNSIAQVGRNVRRKARKIKEESTNLLQDIQNAWVRRSWSEEGDPFHLEHLEHILAPKGEAWGIGPETGKTLKNGISVYRSVGDDPYRSWRFVLSEKGHPVSALQIIERSKTRATISTVFTAPSHRRRGLAEKLLRRARKQFKRVEHSSLRSPAGNAWASAVGLMPVAAGTSVSPLPSVGAKPKWNDPSVKPGELAKLAKANPKAYTNPNLSFDALVDGAKKYPWLVDQNPALSMLGLEDPARQKWLVDALVDGWRSTGMKALSPQSQRLYAADCAEHVLHFMEDKNPNEKRSREAIKVARRFARGEATKEELATASLAGYAAATYLAGAKYSAAAYAAYNAAAASAYNAADYSSYQAAELHTSDAVEMEKEKIWQANRVRFYYAQEHPEYQMPAAVGRAKQKRKIQSVLVSKEEAPRLQSAQRIVRELGLKTKKVDETEANWRFRQHPPEKFQKGTFQTWHLGLPEGVKEIAAIPRRGAKVAGDDLEERRRKNQERAAKQRAAEKDSPAAAKGRAVLEEFERRRRQNTSPSRYPLHVVEDDEKDDIGAVQLWEGGGLLQLPYIGAKKKKGSRVGAGEDPALLLENLDPVALNVAQLTPGFRVDYCLSLLPQKEKMRFVIWCAEQAWRLYIRNSLSTESDPRSRNQMEALWRYQDGKLSQQEVGRYLWEGIYPQANRDAIMAINYAIAEAASPQGPYAEFVARHTSNAMILAANPRATDEEQFNSTREEIMERLRQSLREAYATATEMAREHYYPAFSGAWPTVVEATLLRERARQRLLEIIHGGNSSYMAKLDGTLIDVGIKKAELALAQLAEVTDAQAILAETYHRHRGGKSSKRLWAQAVRYLYRDAKKILSEWNSIKFKFKS